MIEQTLKLNLIPGGVLPRVNVSQYDAGSRTINATLYNGAVLYEVPTDAVCYVRGTKKDNTGFEYECTFDDSVVSFDITQQMTAFAGEVVCEVQIVYSDQILGTANFIICVENTALSDDTVISETDIPIIQNIPTYAAAAAESATEAADSATLSESWATGGTGTREGEDEDNSKYYSEQSQAYLSATQTAGQEAVDDIEEAAEAAIQDINTAVYNNNPIFTINYTDGHLYWEGGRFVWSINSTDGNLYWEVTA